MVTSIGRRGHKGAHITLIITPPFDKSDVRQFSELGQTEFDSTFWTDQTRCRIPSLSESPLSGHQARQLTIEWVGADEEKFHSFVTIIWKHQFGAELPFCDDLHWSDSQLPIMPIQAALQLALHAITHFTITDLDNHFQKILVLWTVSALAFGKYWTKLMTGFFEPVSMDNVGDMWGLIIVLCPLTLC